MRFRIGEKIGLSFGLVGVLFLGVIWQYHETLQLSISNYQGLLDVAVVKKHHALRIENAMVEARVAETSFLLRREEGLAAEVSAAVRRAQERAAALMGVDAEGARTGGKLAELIGAYRARFEAIADAWRIKGLDHNSGLQGAFRSGVHELEARAAHFKVDGLYQQLLQIRRGEKDLGLRREPQYRDKVLGLLEAFEAGIASSGLDEGTRNGLLLEAGMYRKSFHDYARSVLAEEDIHGGKGPFRQSAHRIEAQLQAHYIPDMERNILQLRRREKDYLLRGDRRYVDMALQELEAIRAQVNVAGIAAEPKAGLNDLLDAYQRDFVALVEQNDRIKGLQKDMLSAVRAMSPLLSDNVQKAEQKLRDTSAEIQSASDAAAVTMLWVAALASLLGVVSAIVITLSIAGPLRRMAGLLDLVAYEQPVERIASIPGGRDEVNAMAESVNAMADHKAHFLAWWRASMREAEACEQLAKDPVVARLEEREHVRDARQTLARDLQEQVRGHVRLIAEHVRRLERAHPQAESHDIGQSAKSALAVMDVMLGPEQVEG